MTIKKQNIPTLADSICDLRVRKIKKKFFTQINTILDWNRISSIIDKHYEKGKNATRQDSYDGLLLFKMCLLQSWYGLRRTEHKNKFFFEKKLKFFIILFYA